jgi:hypothetical protein
MHEFLLSEAEIAMLNILSLGAGVQSSTVLLMSCKGELPKLDAAIFADTQWEPKAVYDWLNTTLNREAVNAGIPIYVVSNGHIRDDAMRSRFRKENYEDIEGGRWASMPFYATYDGDDAGMMRRQCTSEYKITPVQRKCRELAGKDGHVTLWMGISGDEMRRMRMSKVKWIENYYPLVFGLKRPWHRHDCVKWLNDNGFSNVPKSSCIGCPYRPDKDWRSMQIDRPEEFADAVKFDEQIRDMGNGNFFLHRSLKPLKMVDFSTDEERGQQNWLNECEGMCGV